MKPARRLHPVHIDEIANFYGLRRNKRGELRFPPHRPPKPECVIPKAQRAKIAACEALGWSYWADHPKPGFVWAADYAQRFHQVKVNVQREEEAA
jgi:hypothetical protein